MSGDAETVENRVDEEICYMISLTAEQKTIEGIFCTTTEMYVIPAYQRPYSWGCDQFYELYKDLMGAYKENESYFLGNIIMARSKSYDNDGKNFVVDGQQRIITLWTLLKMLALHLPDINPLQRALTVEQWTGDKNMPKIDSQIFETNDNEAIKSVLAFDKASLEARYKEVLTNDVINENKCNSRVEEALLYFYQQFVVQQKDLDYLGDFAQFLMKKVTMLPIVQSADEQRDAENKALTIFETINNRGMDLEDADIFKARLYDSAYEDEQRQEFINMWVDFKSECNALRLSVDDVFRYYSHVIRGRERITTNEKKLREFFSNESFSPLKTQSYKSVMEDLNKILSILKYLNNERGASDEVGNWLQIMSAYTNQYPTYSIIVYLYYHDVEKEDEKQDFVVFLQSLVRYCFYMGSTTTVKFKIYDFIKVIANNGKIDPNYVNNLTPDSFNRLGRLLGAYALLAFYLDSGQPIPVKYTIDKIVNVRDEDTLNDNWEYETIDDICKSIGNMVVMDLPKRYNSLQEKYAYYATSEMEYVRSIFKSPDFSFTDWKNRNDHLKGVLLKYFAKPEENDKQAETEKLQGLS